MEVMNIKIAKARYRSGIAFMEFLYGVFCQEVATERAFLA